MVGHPSAGHGGGIGSPAGMQAGNAVLPRQFGQYWASQPMVSQNCISSVIERQSRHAGRAHGGGGSNALEQPTKVPPPVQSGQISARQSIRAWHSAWLSLLHEDGQLAGHGG